MGIRSNKRWLHIICDRILRREGMSGSDGEDCGIGAELREQARDNSEVRTVPDAPAPNKTEVTLLDANVNYSPRAVPEPAPPEVLGRIDQGTSMMYVQTCFWVSAYVQQRAKMGDFSEDQLIEQFGMNVRRCINPNWKANA